MRIGGLLLAAGQSRRISAGRHKLLATFDGVPLVRRSALTLLASALEPVVVVTGYRSDDIARALRDLPVVPVHNADFAGGIGTSLGVGFRCDAFDQCHGVLIMLADMPSITSDDIGALFAAFKSCDGRDVVRGSDSQEPGHPVIVPATLFRLLRNASGDGGARDIIGKSGIPVRLIDIGRAARQDVDTVEAIIAVGGQMLS